MARNGRNICEIKKSFTERRVSYKIKIEKKTSEVVNFVSTTRRWHDRGNPRDAGAWHACRMFSWLGCRSEMGGFCFRKFLLAQWQHICYPIEHNFRLQMRCRGIVGVVEWIESRWLVESGEEAPSNSPWSSSLKQTWSRRSRCLTVRAGGYDGIR